MSIWSKVLEEQISEQNQIILDLNRKIFELTNKDRNRDDEIALLKNENGNLKRIHRWVSGTHESNDENFYGLIKIMHNSYYQRYQRNTSE